MHSIKNHKSKNHIFVRFFFLAKRQREKKIDNKIKCTKTIISILLLNIIPIIVNGWRYCYMPTDEMGMEDKHDKRNYILIETEQFMLCN